MIEDSSLRIVAVELLRKFNFDLVPGQEMHGIQWEGDLATFVKQTGRSTYEQ